jgi:hypothetical protein
MRRRKHVLLPDYTPPPEPAKGFLIIDNRYQDAIGPDPSAWIVYGQLVRHADKEGHCWPSVRLLAKLTGLHLEAVVAALDRLENLRIIQTVKKPGKVTQYWITHHTPTQSKRSELGNGTVRFKATEQEPLQQEAPCRAISRFSENLETSKKR